MAREDSRRPASNNQAQEKPRIDPALMEQWLKNQGAEIQNQAREFDLREKEIDANTALAKQQMALHAEIIKIRPELDIPPKLTPPFRSKVTPLFQRKLTPLFRTKLTPYYQHFHVALFYTNFLA